MRIILYIYYMDLAGVWRGPSLGPKWALPLAPWALVVNVLFVWALVGNFLGIVWPGPQGSHIPIHLH